MLRLATDADVRGPLLHGIESIPELDIVRSIDVLPEGTEDEIVLEWAANEGRVLVTFDRTTMTDSAYIRWASGQHVPGIIVATERQAIREAIDDVHMIAVCMPQEEIADRVVVYLPFRG